MRKKPVCGLQSQRCGALCLEYAETCDQKGLVELAQFAIHCEQTIPPNLVEMMAVNEVPACLIVRLLQPSFYTISYERLAGIL